MLSPSSLSSTSLERSTTLSTSLIAASESSTNSALLDIVHHNNNLAYFPHANSTPLIATADNIYDEYNNHHHQHPDLAFSIPSTSDDVGGTTPLYVLNPCFHSTMFQRQSSDLTSSSFSSNNRNDGGGEHKALRSLQNIQSGAPSSHNAVINATTMQQQPRNTSTRRTISLQIVRPFPTTFETGRYSANDKLAEYGSCCSSASSTKASSIFSDRTASSREHRRFYIANQSAAMMDWLGEKALSQLTKMFQRHSANPSAVSARWLTQMKHLRDFMLQIRGKSQNSDGNRASKKGAPSMKAAPPPTTAEYNLYKMPLGAVQASTADGRPIPQFVTDIMDFLSGQADLAEGIFRKNGGKVRIEEIKEFCSRLTPSQPIPQHLLNDSQVHDLGDSLKRYFRELPECLFTDRLSKMLEDICMELPPERHFAALHCCFLLLPAENRDALLILLKFLKGMARHSATNQMTAQNLATCWMPSLFHFSQEDKNGGGGTLGRKLMRRKTIGIPSEAGKNAYKGIKEMLAMMIEDWERLANVPKSLATQIGGSGNEQEGAEDNHNNGNEGGGPALLDVCHDLCVPTKMGKFEFTDDLQLRFRRQLFRLKEDYFAGWPGWTLQRVFPDGTQLFTRSINDMIPLRSFRVQTSIAAPANLILNAILRWRNFYDSNVLECKRTGGPCGQNFDIIRVQYRTPLGSDEKYAYMARRWTYSELDIDSLCTLVECSIVPRSGAKQQNGGGGTTTTAAGGRVSVYESKFLISEICPGHSQLVHISRTDFRGRPSLWYDRVYGEMLVNHVRRLKQLLFKFKVNSRGTIV